MPEDIWGDKIETRTLLRDLHIENPFSVLDSKSGGWQKRKKMWGNLGIRSEVGRDVKLFEQTNKSFANEKYGRTKKNEINPESIFDPVLCEVLYRWFCPNSGRIIDPFAGGSVRGIIANYLGFNYTGIDIRKEQIDSNLEQAKEIIPDNIPNWIVGDSNIELDNLLFEDEFDLALSCPPYADLEVYSDLKGDISNMKYEEFLHFYESIIRKTCSLLKQGGFCAWVVGEVRDKKSGKLYGFVPDTINIFKRCGMAFYNDAILLNSMATAMLRVGNTFVKGGGKLVKVHQNILVFKKY